MKTRDRLAIVVLHLLALLTVALVILFVVFAADLHLRELFGPTLVWTVTAVGLALAIGVELTVRGLRQQQKWARATALCLIGLYAMALLLPLGLVGLWGFGSTASVFCGGEASDDCLIVSVPRFPLAPAVDDEPVTEQTFQVQIGDHVAPDQPAQGAGRIEAVRTRDRYLFTAAPGTVLFLKTEQPCTIKAAHWALRDAANVLIQDGANLCRDMWRAVLEKGGTYALSVSSDEQIGDYAFTLQTITDDQPFSLKIGDHVAPGRPGPGAGSIEKPGTVDRYTFTAEPGTLVSLKAEPPCSSQKIKLIWEIWNAEGGDASYRLGYGQVCRNTGYFPVKRAGTYTITVKGWNDETGEYGFALQADPADNTAAFERRHLDLITEATTDTKTGDAAIPSQPVTLTGIQKFTLAIGDHVAPDRPGPGAGSIEKPGTVDRYTFSAESGTIVYLKAEPPCNGRNRTLLWEIHDIRDADARRWQDTLGKGEACRNTGYFPVPRAGTYTITVFGIQDGTGTYGFGLQSAPADDPAAFERLHQDLIAEANRSAE